MSLGESDRRPPDASSAGEPVETPPEGSLIASPPPGALRRLALGMRAGWRRVGGWPGVFRAAGNGARWIYRNRSRIGAGVRRFGEVLISILKTSARIGGALVAMGEALARLDRERTGERTGPGRRNAARAGAGLSRLGRRLDRYGRGLLPVADGIEDIGEHLETASPGDPTPLPPALPDPAPPKASAPERDTVPDPGREPVRRPASAKTGTTTADPARSTPPEKSDAPPAAKPETPDRPPPRPRATEPPLPASKPAATADPTSAATPGAEDPAAALPEELRARIRDLRRHRSAGRAELETLIVDLCRAREWSTTAELAAILGRSPRSLNRHYLRPMAAAGRLVRRHPGHPRHPAQAFTAPG